MVQAIGDPDKGKIYIGLFDLTPVDGILPLGNIDSTCNSTFQAFELTLEFCVAFPLGIFSSSATASLRSTPPPPMAIAVVPIVPIPSSAAIQPATSHFFQFFILVSFHKICCLFLHNFYYTYGKMESKAIYGKRPMSATYS